MSINFLPYKESSLQLLQFSGGESIKKEGYDFVTQVGILLLKGPHGLTSGAKQIMDYCNISAQQDDDKRLAEFTARITNLSFPVADKSEQQSILLHKQLQEKGHYSPYEIVKNQPIILVSGLAVETIMEIVANGYWIGRQTSSRTRSMDTPIFRIPHILEKKSDKIMDFIIESEKRFLQLRGEVFPQKENSKDQIESINMAHTGYKAGHVVIAAPLDFWNKKLKRRLEDDTDGVEYELRCILEKIITILEPLNS